MTPTSKFIVEFKEFLSGDLDPAIQGLDKLSNSSRVHIQKLIYTNLVDRFDYVVDKTILSLVSHRSFRDQLLNEMKEPLTEDKLFRFVLESPADLLGSVYLRLQEQARQTILRHRHSKKLEKLCGVLLPEENLQKPQVNESSGTILKQRKFHKQIPLSIVGYADWLYSKRNAVVHGGEQSQVLKTDLDYMKKTNKGLVPAEKVRLSISSIQNVAKFYSDLTEKFLKVFDPLEGGDPTGIERI